MNIEKVHHAFAEVVNIRGIYNKLNVPKNNVTQYRWKLKRGVHITIDKKLWVLQRAGYRLESFQYTDKDMVALIKFTLDASQATRNMGPEYCFEKWRESVDKKRK